jgi:hypothetical protein
MSEDVDPLDNLDGEPELLIEDMPRMGRRPLPRELFVLPEDFDDHLKLAYSVIINNLREEAAHLSLTTLQELLIERIAFNYVALRHRELHEGFTHEAAQRHLNSFWLSMTQEFHRVVGSTPQAERDGLVVKFTGVVREVLTSVADQEQRTELQRTFRDAFDRADL